MFGLHVSALLMPKRPFGIVLVCTAVIWFLNCHHISALRTYDENRLAQLREEVKSMFYHAYDSYIRYAYPYDELRPLSCDGVDTWGSYSLTLIDALDTLAVIGNYSEFRRVAQLIIDDAHFDMNINVSVFETNIRIIGGLLSAHMLSHKAGMELEKGWPCNGPLLRLAEKVARKLLPAFDTNTGMPYGTVNLRYGVPAQETPVTCSAGVGTFIVEFGALSRLTGDPVYEKVALRAMHALYSRRSPLDLFGNHIDTQTGKWTAVDSGIGAGVDSFFEYLVKGAILFQRPELMHMFRVSYRGIEKHLSKNGWYVWATMGQGHVSSATFQSLESYWPGLLSLVGEFRTGIKAIANYHRIWKQYGALPELYNIIQGKASHQREGYPLRPELVESAMYLYRATGDPYMLEIGEDMLRSISHIARTECGFATIRDVTTLTLEDRMESFFLAETTKYLYLLFDPKNFIHSQGEDYTVIDNPRGQCIVYAGGYIFNTEAHPMDPGALNCCTGDTDAELHEEVAYIDEFRFSQAFEGKHSLFSDKKERRDFLRLSETELDYGISDTDAEIDPAEEESSEEDISPPAVRHVEPAKVEVDSDGLYFDISKYKRSLSEMLSCRRPTFESLVVGNQMCNQEVFEDDLFLNVDIPSPVQPFVSEESLLERLLKRLFHDEQKEEGVKRTDERDNVIESEKANLLLESKNIEKMVEYFESSSGTVVKVKGGLVEVLQEQESLEGPVGPLRQGRNTKRSSGRLSSRKDRSRFDSSTNRIQNSNGDQEPDLDLIFGTRTNERTLSFYFSLKWLREFPELIRQLIPSERFDLDYFYDKINKNSTNEEISKIYNISLGWFNNYRVLRCPDMELADRFLFFKSSVD